VHELDAEQPLHFGPETATDQKMPRKFHIAQILNR
jgi:hypothetical protein